MKKDVDTMDEKIEHDEWGPEYLINLYDPETGMDGFVVIDNTALGPGKGGIRMTSSVTLHEDFRLARTMTWKCALAELPFGGAKGAIVYSKDQKENKEALVRAYSRLAKIVAPNVWVAAPDVNTGENEMKWFADENGSMKSCTGKPENMGGIPHELGSTGFGVYHATLIALDHLGMDVGDVKVAVEGFGNVGSFAVKFLSEAGANVVAVSDSKGTIYNKDGLDFDRLRKVKDDTGAVKNYDDGEVLGTDEIFELPVDVLIPAALSDVITDENWRDVKAKIIVEGANIPIPDDVEKKLHENDILVIPDFVANAGGVISSYVEYIEGDNDMMFKEVENRVRKNTKLVLEKSKKESKYPRAAALEIAKERVREAMKNR